MVMAVSHCTLPLAHHPHFHPNHRPSPWSDWQELRLSSTRGKWIDIDADDQVTKQLKKKFNVSSMRLIGSGQWCLLRKSPPSYIHPRLNLAHPSPSYKSSWYRTTSMMSWQIDECTQKELKIFCDTPPPLLLHHPKDHLHLTPTNLNLNRAPPRTRTRILFRIRISSSSR